MVKKIVLLSVLLPGLALGQSVTRHGDDLEIKVPGKIDIGSSAAAKEVRICNGLSSGSDKCLALAATSGAVTVPAGLTATAGGVTITAGGLKFGAGQFESVAAAGSVQGDGGALAAGKFVHYVTASNETKTVVLPACAAGNVGELHILLNAVTDKFLKVFPATGAAINGGSANAAWSQAATGGGGRPAICYCQAANTWYCG